MKRIHPHLFSLGFALAFLFTATAQASEPLPSWNAGKTKQAIIQFVEDVTQQGGPHYVAPEARIATFDNDGRSLVYGPLINSPRCRRLPRGDGHLCHPV